MAAFLVLLLVCYHCSGVVRSFAQAALNVSFFILICNLEVRPRAYMKTLRQMSTYVYFLHLYVWMAVYTLLYHKLNYGPVPFFLTVVIAVLLSFFIVKMQKGHRFNNLS